MMDDPREILQAASVECAEVDGFFDDLAPYWCQDCNEVHERVYSELNRRLAEDARAAILALARLVAELKADKTVTHIMEAVPPLVRLNNDGTTEIIECSQCVESRKFAEKYRRVAESLQTDLLQAALNHDFSIPTLAARLAEDEADFA